MIRFAPYAIVMALFGAAVWWVMDLRATATALAAENATLGRSVASLEISRDQSILARAVADESAAREAREASDTARVIVEILTADLEECADATIGPALSDLIDGLHRSAD